MVDITAGCSILSSEPSYESPGQSHGGARDCSLRPHVRKAAHMNENDGERDCQIARSNGNITHLVRSSERRGNDAHREPASPVGNVEKESHSPRWGRALHRMPPEVLGMVFEHCLDSPGWQLSSRPTPLEPPLLLGRVCSYWRSVAQRTPRLWTSLSIRFLETQVDRSRDGTRVGMAVDTWLHRSYPVPLSITFIDNRIFQKDTEDVVIWLLSCIRTHASRWTDIYLKFSSDYFTRLAVLSSCAFTSLASFSVHIDHMGWRRGLLSLRLDLLKANRLTSLAYTGPDHVIREEILLDWTRLASVALSYDLHEAGGQSATLPRYFSMLARCQDLTELSIGLSISLAQHLQIQESLVTSMIELPRLHTLRVRRLSRSMHACALVDAFVLPQLSTLNIDSAVLVGWDGSLAPSPVSLTLSQQQQQGDHDLDPTSLVSAPAANLHATETPAWHAHHFSALLERSACHLRALHIRDVDISPAELTRLLTSPSASSTLSTFTFEPYPRAYPISDLLAHLVSARGAPGSGPDLDPHGTHASSRSLSPSLSLSSISRSRAGSSSSPSPGPGAGPGLISGCTTTTSFTPTEGSPSLSLPALIKLRLGCAHETHLGPLADIIESRTGKRAARASVQPLAVFELVFYDFVYNHGNSPPGHVYDQNDDSGDSYGYTREQQGRHHHPRRRRRKAQMCFDAFRERVLRCAREAGGVDIEIKVERPYEPVYLSIPS